jgi:hypothetical protein
MTVAEFKFDSLTGPENINNPFVKKIQEHKEYFHRTMECFTEEDSNFLPANNLLSVAGQVLHVALSIEFFLSGMFGPYDGFGPLSRFDRGFTDMSWATLANEKNLGLALDANAWPKAVEASKSIAKALELFDQTMDIAAKMFALKTIQQIQTEQLPENPLFPPFYTYADILEIVNDHTAHHRGSLVVYAHLVGRDPKIPYFEMSEALLHSQRIQCVNSED